jgi:hypothetical protein
MDIRDSGDEDIDMAFPSYEVSGPSFVPVRISQPSPKQDDHQPQSNPAVEGTTFLRKTTQDDQAIQSEPTSYADYLSHEWKEEDIWLSWSYVVHRRRNLANSVRLENALWRSWVKAKYHLKTVRPEILSWVKDCDVTWLYGPLQTNGKETQSMSNAFPPLSHMPRSSSFSKKSILKKKSASAAILERSQHSLLQSVGGILSIQQLNPTHDRLLLTQGNSEVALPQYTGSTVVKTSAEHDLPGLTRTNSSFAYPELLTPPECRHVLFDEEVRQVQAIDSGIDKVDKDDIAFFEDDEDDDCGLMMAPSLRLGCGGNRSALRAYSNNESKMIAPLPSTTLKYGTDTPEPQEPDYGETGPLAIQRERSPSPPQATPVQLGPNRNFLIDNDFDAVDELCPVQTTSSDKKAHYTHEDDGDDPEPQMGWTEPNMFIPYNENGEEEVMNSTLFGQAIYAVNTFRDIAYVVWTVGWNQK